MGAVAALGGEQPGSQRPELKQLAAGLHNNGVVGHEKPPTANGAGGIPAAPPASAVVLSEVPAKSVGQAANPTPASMPAALQGCASPVNHSSPLVSPHRCPAVQLLEDASKQCQLPAKQEPLQPQHAPAGASPPVSAPSQPLPPASAPASGPIASAAPVKAEASQQQAAAQDPALQQPLQCLQALLNRISGALDPSGFFQQPVPEVDAPGYYNVIARPMCFLQMQEKLRVQAYRTWRGFVEDFELICNNAMTYNQKRSRIHKSAITMLRAGKKLLQGAEPQGRTAIAQLHPGGPAAAAEDEAREAAELAARPGPSGKAGRGASASGGQPGLGRAMSLLETGTTGETEDMQLDMFSTDDEAYSSFSDTDAEAEEGDWRNGISRAAERFLRHVGQATECRAWSAPGTSQPGGEPLADRQADLDVPDAPSGRSRTWKSHRRSVEWRMRWLELRLAELKHQQQRQQDNLQRLRQRPSAKPTTSGPASASEGAVPVVGAQQQQQQQPQQPPPAVSKAAVLSASQQRAGGKAAVPHTRQRRRRLELQELALPQLLAHPFFSRHMHHGSKRRCQENADAAETQPSAKRAALGAAGSAEATTPQAATPLLATTPPATDSAAAPAAMDAPAAQGVKPEPAMAAAGPLSSPLAPGQEAADDEDDWFPGRVHAALELLERQVCLLKRQLVQRTEAAAVPEKGAGMRGKAKGGARGGGGGAARGTRSGLQRRSGAPPQKTFERQESRLGKRRREYELADMVAPQTAGGGPKFVERLQVANINTPQVRLLGAAELNARKVAVAAWNATLKAQAASLATNGADAATPAPAAGDGGDSSDEDSSDEAFLARHAPKEQEERVRFMTFAGGGAQKKNPPPKSLRASGTAPSPAASQQPVTVAVAAAAAATKTADGPATQVVSVIAAAVAVQGGTGGCAVPESPQAPQRGNGLDGSGRVPGPGRGHRGPMRGGKRHKHRRHAYRQQQQQQQQQQNGSAAMPPALAPAPAAAAPEPAANGNGAVAGSGVVVKLPAASKPPADAPPAEGAQQ